jgi:ABC-type nickel/cobalt efflux system permease component RcnA
MLRVPFKSFLEWIAAALVATIALSIGTGALHISHLATHSHTVSAASETSSKKDAHGHRCHGSGSSGCNHRHDDATTDDVEECDTCVILTILGVAPTCAPAPIVFVTSISLLAERDTPLTPAPQPLRVTAARPPPMRAA